MGKFLDYTSFLAEKENVKIDKELREYTLTHLKDDRFQLKSGDFLKDFSVLPYKSEVLEPLRKVHEKLVSAIESSDPKELFSALQFAETVSYPYGGIYKTEFTLSEIPELTNSLTDDQRSSLASSEREFVLNNVSQLGREIKDDLVQVMRERAEVTCSVIEALFYYTRIIDKDSYYEGMSRDEMIEEYQTAVSKSAKEERFSFDGPFSDTEKSPLRDDSKVALWRCEKDEKSFFVKATVSPKEMYSEENLGGTRGLKLSLLLKSDEPLQDYSYFPIEDLDSRIETFYDNILKKK